MEQNKVINSRSLTFLKEFCDKQFPGFTTNGKEDNRCKTTTYEVKAEMKRTEVKPVKITEEQYNKLKDESKVTKDGEFFQLKENIIWGYDTLPHTEELIQACIHAKLCCGKVPPDTGCRFYIGKYMRKSTTRISPPSNDVALRAVFNFDFDEIYKLDPKYTDGSGSHDSGLSPREILIKKDMLEVLGPYNMSKYCIKVSNNTTQSKQTTPVRGTNSVKLRPSKYQRITMVVDFWYPYDKIETLDDFIGKFLETDQNETKKVLGTFGVKTNHSINKKINKEKTKLAQQTKKLVDDRIDKQLSEQLLLQGGNAEDFF